MLINPYGNYFVQFLIENSNNKEMIPIISYVTENLFSLSLNKYSSNVVIKILALCTEREVLLMAKGLFDDPSKLVPVCKDKYLKSVIFKLCKLIHKKDANEFLKGFYKYSVLCDEFKNLMSKYVY